MASPRIRTGDSTVAVGHLSHHAITWHLMENSRTDQLPLAQSRTNLGHVSFSSHHTKQFSLPHHAPTFSRIPTLCRIAPHPSPSCPHPMEVSWPLGNCPDYPSIPLPFASELPPTDLHTGSRRDSPPVLNNLLTHTSATVPTPSISLG